MILTEAPTRNLTLTLNKAPALTRTETVAHAPTLTGAVPRAQAATDEARIAAATSLASTPGVRAALRAYRAQELLGQLAGVLMVAHKALPPVALELLAWRNAETRLLQALPSLPGAPPEVPSWICLF